MSGRRLLDAIQVLNVAKSVAARHLAVRQRQLDVYTRTSSLTKGIKNQTEGLILTAQAAAALAKKFNEPENPRPSPPPPPPPASHEAASAQSDVIRGQTPTEAQPTPAHVAGASTGLTPDMARRAQRQAEFQIPASAAEHSANDGETSGANASNQQDVFYQPSTQQSLELSSLPRVKIPKTTGEYQGGAGSGINSDVYHSAVESETKPPSVEEQSELPEEMMKQIFHSPKVARKLFRHGHASLRKDGERQAGSQLGAAQNEAPVAPTSSERQAEKEDLEQLGASIASDIGSSTQEPSMTTSPEVPSEVAYEMMESRVPASRLGRLWQYGGLATSMAFGAIGEGFRRATGGTQGDSGSIMFSAGNMERMVSKLSKMRGAALKLGQMLSFQDSKMLPEPIAQVLQRVQDRADYMPASQRDKVLAQNLGPDWRELFSSFDEVPMAAASIGQVHKAFLKKTSQPVAVKIQYPGVADSIDSDLNNLSILLTASRLLPKGLYLDKTIANARTELAWECDYIREAECAERFRHLLQDDPVFVVPAIIPEASGQQVLTMELLHGVAVTKIKTFTQPQRDWIGTQILRLCLREITEFKYMQTDPNWTNFLYNPQTNKLELLDFGASRAYPCEFIDKYVRTLVAATRHDRKTCHELSIDLGYLTGYESPAMVEAHVTSILTLAEPFVESSPDVYDFRDQTITDRVRGLIPVMLRERLAPPPEETYSLHRKLSGAFLLCARLGSRVRCKELFAEAVRKAEREGLDLGVEKR